MKVSIWYGGNDMYERGVELFNKYKAECSETHSDFNKQYRFVMDSRQWTEKELKGRGKQKRPSLTVNILKRIVQDEVNRVRKASPSIRVKPSTSKDTVAANLVELKVHEIQYASDADIAYDIAATHALVGGIGFIRVDIDYLDDASVDLGIKVSKVLDPTKVYFDVSTPTVNGSEWKDVFVVITDDLEAEPMFMEGTKKCYVEWFHKEETKVMKHKLSDGSIVEDFDEAFYAVQGITSVKSREVTKYEVTKYLLGEEIISSVVVVGGNIPIIPVIGDNYVVDGKWKVSGVVKDSMDSQASYNIARSKMTEVINTSPKVSMIVGHGGVIDPDKWSQLNDPSIPYLEYDFSAGSPIPLARANDVSGVSNLAESYYADIKLIQGIQENVNTDEFLAKLKGDTANYHFTDNLAKSIERLGKIIVAMIPSVYEVDIPLLGIEVKVGDNAKNRVEESIYTLTELIRVFPEGRAIAAPLLIGLMDFEGKEQVVSELNQLKNPQPEPVVTAPTLEQQMLMLREQNIARDIEYKNAVLMLDTKRFEASLVKDDNEMKIKEALALKTIEVDTKALNIKQQQQDLAEAKLGVDIVSKAV